MATTAILRSEGCLLRQNRFHRESMSSSPPVKPCRNVNLNSIRSCRRKRSPAGSPDRIREQDRSVEAKFSPKHLVMGQVKILKRGEELRPQSAAKKKDPAVGYKDLVLCSTDRLGPEPETVQSQIRVPHLKSMDGLYAGSAVFLASPPPSSLPFPAFFANKEKNDAATSDLRRLLGLDLL
ncbi:hypothetical protein NMG60_11013139 [Bertholletia excelsa]